jgi:hypothetical protein
VGELKRGEASKIYYREFKRDFVPLQKKSPPSLVREGGQGDRLLMLNIVAR